MTNIEQLNQQLKNDSKSYSAENQVREKSEDFNKFFNKIINPINFLNNNPNKTNTDGTGPLIQKTNESLTSLFGRDTGIEYSKEY